MQVTSFPPAWSSLTAIGESRTIRSSVVWLIAVPIVAKLLGNMPETLHVQAFGSTVELHLRLPFSWQLFYFAAVAFAVASGLYSLFCPHIVRHYTSYADYDRDRRLEPYLIRVGSGLGLTLDTIKSLAPVHQFWTVHEAADKSQRLARASATVLYGVGFALFGYILLQNFIAVLSRATA